MMEITTIKYQFIEEIIKINNPDIILSLKKTLKKLKKQKTETPDWMKFSGIWNKEEAKEISEIITDCEKVDLNKW